MLSDDVDVTIDLETVKKRPERRGEVTEIRSGSPVGLRPPRFRGPFGQSEPTFAG